MNENDRNKIVKMIDDSLENLLKLNLIRDLISEYEKNDKVKEYIKLVDELKILESKVNNFTADEVKEDAFKWAISYNGEFIDECEHPAWLYEEALRSDNGNKVYIYSCLECGRKHATINKSLFEENNKVLKAENPKYNYLYRNRYYKYLYDCDEKTALNKLECEHKKVKKIK